MQSNKRSGIDLLLAQYRNSPNLISYISNVLEELGSVKTVLQDVVTKRYLDSSFGQQVDDISAIVGTARTIPGANPLGYFGFYDNSQALGLDAGLFKSDADKDSGDLVLTDDGLKGRIRARVIKTMGMSSIEDILEYLDKLVGRSLDIELTEGFRSIDLKYHGEFEYHERAVVAAVIRDIKVTGVSMTLQDDSGIIDITPDSLDFPNV